MFAAILNLADKITAHLGICALEIFWKWLVTYRTGLLILNSDVPGQFISYGADSAITPVRFLCIPWLKDFS